MAKNFNFGNGFISAHNHPQTTTEYVVKWALADKSAKPSDWTVEVFKHLDEAENRFHMLTQQRPRNKICVFRKVSIEELIIPES